MHLLRIRTRVVPTEAVQRLPADSLSYLSDPLRSYLFELYRIRGGCGGEVEVRVLTVEV